MSKFGKAMRDLGGSGWFRRIGSINPLDDSSLAYWIEMQSGKLGFKSSFLHLHTSLMYNCGLPNK